MKVKHLVIILLAIFSGVFFGVAVSTQLLISGSLGSTFRAYVVESGSMEPAIKTGSIVITKSADKYITGDVITFAPNGDINHLVTHRVNSVTFAAGDVENPEFTTKGDANEEPDTWTISNENIVGKEFITLPYLGYVSAFVRTPKGFVILVIIPASIIIYEELKSIGREIALQLKKVRKKKKSETPNSSSKLTRGSILIPVFGGVLLMFTASGAFFLDKEESPINILGAATSYDQPASPPTESPNPTTTPLPKINEFMPSPSNAPEWVEFYNASASADYIKNYYLDDDTDFINDSGSSAIKPLTNLNTDNPNFPYLEFSSFLNNGGDYVVLFNESGSIIDQYQYPPPTPDSNISIGRDTDASGSFKNCTAPTEGASNNGSC